MNQRLSLQFICEASKEQSTKNWVEADKKGDQNERGKMKKNKATNQQTNRQTKQTNRKGKKVNQKYLQLSSNQHLNLQKKKKNE